MPEPHHSTTKPPSLLFSLLYPSSPLSFACCHSPSLRDHRLAYSHPPPANYKDIRRLAPGAVPPAPASTFLHRSTSSTTSTSPSRWRLEATHALPKPQPTPYIYSSVKSRPRKVPQSARRLLLQWLPRCHRSPQRTMSRQRKILFLSSSCFWCLSCVSGPSLP